MSHSKFADLREQSVAKDGRDLVAARSTPDSVIEHADGTLELGGYIFNVDWDAIDPPEGHPDAEKMSHEEVMAEMCEFMGLPPGSL